MNDNQKQILQMLADGKITVDEAQRLLSLVNTEKQSAANETSAAVKNNGLPRYLRVVVEPKTTASAAHSSSKVNVRVPFGLIKAGMKLATLIPGDAVEKVDGAFKEKGIPFDFNKLKDDDIEALITALHDSEINVDTENETVRVYAE